MNGSLLGLAVWIDSSTWSDISSINYSTCTSNNKTKLKSKIQHWIIQPLLHFTAPRYNLVNYWSLELYCTLSSTNSICIPVHVHCALFAYTSSFLSQNYSSVLEKWLCISFFTLVLSFYRTIVDVYLIIYWL